MWFLEIEIMWWVEWRGMADSGQWTMLYGPGVGFVDDDDNYRFGFFDSRSVWLQAQIPIYTVRFLSDNQ